jgi:hypothetical protein
MLLLILMQLLLLVIAGVHECGTPAFTAGISCSRQCGVQL